MSFVRASAFVLAVFGASSCRERSATTTVAPALLADSRAMFGASRLTSSATHHDLSITVPSRLRDKLSLDRGRVHIDITASSPTDEDADWVDGVAVFRGAQMFRRVTENGVEDLYRIEQPQASFRARYEVVLGAIVEPRTSAAALELVDERGVAVFHVPAPLAIDARGTERRGSIQASCVDGRCAVDFTVATDGLVFPILIDPAWETTGALKYTHYHHVALSLSAGIDSGKTLVAGGTGAYPASTELYDPVTRTWTAGAPLPDGVALLEGTRGAVLANGAVLLAGGLSLLSTDAQKTAVLRDPTTGAWTRIKDMTDARAHHAMAVVTIGGKERVLVAGGQKAATLSATSPPLATAEMYAPETNTWSSIGFLKNGRSEMASVVLGDGRVAVIGGQTIASTSIKQVDSTEVYDATLDGWLSGPRMTTPRTAMGVARLTGAQVLVAGGYGVPAGSFSAVVLDTVETLDFAATTATMATTKLTQPRRDLTATRLADGRVVLAGGSSTSSTSATSVVDMWGGSAVTPLAALAEPRLYHSANLLPNGHVLLAAGWAGPTAAQQSRTVEVLDIDLGRTCAATSECPAGRSCVDGVCCASASCPSGQVCNAPGRKGVCVKAKGATCATAAECATGYCVDGVCCTEPCTGLCRSCALPGTEGTCTNAGAGTDPRASCRGSSDVTCAKKCDGTGKCEAAYAPVGTTCGASLSGDAGLAFCTAHTCTSTGSCALGTNTCGLTCVTSSSCNETSKTCSVTGTITAGNCLIDSKCYKTAETKPGDPCSLCDPATSNTAWTTSLACDAGVDSGPETEPIVDAADTAVEDVHVEDTIVVDSNPYDAAPAAEAAVVPPSDLPAAAACGCDVPGRTQSSSSVVVVGLLGALFALRRRHVVARVSLTVGCGANATRDEAASSLIDASAEATSIVDSDPSFDVAIGDVAMSETLGDAACAGKEVAAIKPPVDIIVVVDQSGSMSSEIAQVKANINKLSDQLTKAYLDYRVVMIAKPGMGTYEVCVPPPLGGLDCKSNPPLYRASSQEVQSNDALQRILETYDNVLPSIGWRDMLRAHSTKIFVPITDDNATMPKPVAPLATVAEQFDSELLKRSEQFGTAEKRRYRFYPICGASAADATVLCGSGMVNTGSTYTDLVRLAGGKWFPLCASDYGPVFIDMARSLAGELACELTLPAPPAGETLDPNKVNVVYTSSDGTKTEIVPQDNSKTCNGGANGWQYSDDRTKVLLCGAACTRVREDLGAKLNIQFGCRTKID
jgi:hypothetical protein